MNHSFHPLVLYLKSCLLIGDRLNSYTPFVHIIEPNEGVFIVSNVSTSLQAFHLPSLKTREILLAQMDPADLVADDICFDVLLCFGLQWK
jgi:hypothetical protein